MNREIVAGYGRCGITAELHTGNATVQSRCDDDCLCRVEVRTDDGMAGALSAAHLVRQAVIHAVARGQKTVAMTLDVASPACGAVLAELRNLADDGVGTLQVRRAGETVLVDVDLCSTVVAERVPARASADQATAGTAAPATPPNGQPGENRWCLIAAHLSQTL